MSFKRILRKTIYNSDWINLYADKVETPEGEIIDDYHQIDFPRKSVVVIVTKQDKICLIKSYRYTLDEICTELPAGFIDSGETPEKAAVREVKEETGLIIEKPKFLFKFYPSNGISNQLLHVFTAKTESEIKVDKNHEGIQDVFWLSIKEINDLIKNNQIEDGISLIALLKYFHSLKV